MCNAHCAMCIQADLPLNNMWTSCKVGQSTVLHPFNCPKLSIGDIVHSLHITIKEHLRDMMEKGRLKKKLWDFMAIFLCSGRGVFSIPYLCRVYGSIKTVQKRLGEDQCSILHCVQQRMQRIWHTMHSASGTQCTAECEMREAQGWAAAASRGQPCITSLHHADDNLIMMMRDLDDNRSALIWRPCWLEIEGWCFASPLLSMAFSVFVLHFTPVSGSVGGQSFKLWWSG